MRIDYGSVLTILLTAVLLSGCSGSNNPAQPSIEDQPATQNSVSSNGSTHLWGLFDIIIEPDSLEVIISPQRNAMFTANVVTFLNANPAYLALSINEVVPSADFIDVDLNISIAHPFPGMPQFDGYDVRGVFMGAGSMPLSYNSDLIVPVQDVDQFMMDDPDDADGGGPDGYTRWFNPTEFDPALVGVPILAYTQGKLATNGYTASATMNPYKYFADDLAVDEDVFTWLSYSYDMYGQFSSGGTSTRNYYLRFPTSEGVKFNYAILANWEAAIVHPSNAPEAVACSVIITEDLYFVDSSDFGGKIKADVSVFDWFSEITDGVMEDYTIFIESNILDAPHEFSISEMTPIGGTAQYSTYRTEIPADVISSLDGNEMFVIVECADYDYQNEFGAPNLAYTDPLAAIFRYDLPVLDTDPNHDPICDLVIDPSTPMPAEGWDVGVPVTFDATGSYDEDGDALTFEWDFDGDDIYDEDPDDLYEGDPDNPTHKYKEDYVGPVNLRLTDTSDGLTLCSVDVDVTTWPSKNIPLRVGYVANDFGVNSSNGDVYVAYEDRQIWIYPLADFYSTGSFTYSVASWAPENMDVAGTGYAVYSNDPYYRILDPSGVETAYGYFKGPVRDVASFSDSGTYADGLTVNFGATLESDPPGDPYIRQWLYFLIPPDYVYDYYSSWCGYHYDEDTGNTGLEKTFYEWVIAIDTDLDGEGVWLIEQPDYYATRWYKSGYIMTFSGDYFGDGTEDSWTDLRDMSRDTDNRFHCLDFVDPDPLIRVYTGDSDGGALEGNYGDSENIASDPISIDGSDFDGNMVVLHGTLTDTAYMVSVFLPEETPE